ncbi:MAG: cupin domain-containing protein [Aromatoleum sp.]|nr:cupin domain-containing protein [Aromatoleum sp.]
MNERASSADAEGVFEPFHISRVPWEEFFRGERFGMRFQQLGAFGGGSQISVCMEALPPGKQANLVHFHMLEEEHVFILEGGLTLQLGVKSCELSAGHYVCFPAGQKLGHALVNRSTEPCRYLVLGNPHPNDVVVFPDTGRVSVRLTGKSYRTAATMEYWEGVDVDAAV